jgi:hypothetical protein
VSGAFSGVPRKFVRKGGVQQIQLRTEDRENGDPGVVALLSGFLEAAVIWYKKFHFEVDILLGISPASES